MQAFCTYFDKQYLPTGLALYRSLVQHCRSFRLWVLCLDRETYEILSRAQMPNLELIPLEELESENRRLLEVKRERSVVEYYFTCTPALPLYLLERSRDLDLVTYVDADLFFFSDLQPIYDEFGQGSVLIIGHRFPPYLADAQRYGLYNVGLLAFRNDDDALQCLRWWRDRCLEWCFDRVEDGRFADQKYLDEWPSRFRNVVVLEHRGAGLAPWNVANYQLRHEGGQIRVESEDLIFFHFTGLRQLNRWVYDPALDEYGVRPRGVLKHGIYAPYIGELRKVARWVATLTNGAAATKGLARPAVAARLSRRPPRTVRRYLSMMRRVLQGQLLYVVGDRIL